MKAGTKTFLFGVLAGVGLSIVITVVAVGISSRLYMNRLRDTLEERIGPPPIPESQAAEYGWSATDLDGATYSMDMLRGSVTVLTFWKPDCFTCTEQLRYLQQLAARLEGAPVLFAAVSVGNADATREAVAREEIALPVYLLEGERPAAFKTSSLPTTFVLNPQGRVAFRHAGVARWDDPVVEDFLQSLAAPSGPAGR